MQWRWFHRQTTEKPAKINEGLFNSKATKPQTAKLRANSACVITLRKNHKDVKDTKHPVKRQLCYLRIQKILV
jgi:hypothetical protein